MKEVLSSVQFVATGVRLPHAWAAFRTVMEVNKHGRSNSALDEYELSVLCFGGENNYQ